MVGGCAICGTKDDSQVHAKDGHRYVQCSRCGCVRLLDPDRAVAAAEESFDALYAEERPYDELTSRRYRATLLWLERYRSRGTLLDVGCGNGQFLSVARELRWTVQGTELSPAACARTARAGMRVERAELTALALPSKSYDVVSMQELIEHLMDPLEYLREAHRILRSGGCLYLTTPNYDSLTRRVLGGEWPVIGPFHFSYFNSTALRFALRDAGFRRIRVTTRNASPHLVLARFRSGSRTDSLRAAKLAQRELRYSIERNVALIAMKHAANFVLGRTGLGDAIAAFAEA